MDEIKKPKIVVVGVGTMENKYTYSDKKKECNCILHCKKDDWNNLEDDELNKKIKLFWETVQKEIRAIDLEIERLSKQDDEYQIDSYLNKPKKYKGVIFPSFQVTKIGNSYNFTTYSEMTEEEIITIFSLKNIELIECHFLDIANFSQYNFFKSVKFEKCQFRKGILFSKTHENHLEFNDCDFCSNNIDLSDRIFKFNLYLNFRT
jgi:hypothetical protein